MSISDLIVVNFYVESGCDVKEEVSVDFASVNGNLRFAEIDEIREAVDEYIADNKFEHEVTYEVLFKKVVENDGAGAITARYYEPVHRQVQAW